MGDKTCGIPEGTVRETSDFAIGFFCPPSQQNSFHATSLYPLAQRSHFVLLKMADRNFLRKLWSETKPEIRLALNLRL